MQNISLSPEERRAIQAARRSSHQLKKTFREMNRLRTILREQDHVSEHMCDDVAKTCAQIEKVIRKFLLQNGTFLEARIKRLLSANRRKAGFRKTKTSSIDPDRSDTQQVIDETETFIDGMETFIANLPKQIIHDVLALCERYGYLKPLQHTRLAKEVGGWIKAGVLDAIPLSGLLLKLLDSITGLDVEETLSDSATEPMRRVACEAMLNRTSAEALIAVMTADMFMHLGGELGELHTPGSG